MDTLRISDADREEAVGLLSEQYAEGRLDKDEFDERSDAVWSARTRGDLSTIFADLPVRTPDRSRRSQRPPGPAWAAALAGPTGRRGRGWPFPLVPVLFLLIALTVLTHLPFVLIAVALFVVLGPLRHGGCGARR